MSIVIQSIDDKKQMATFSPNYKIIHFSGWFTGKYEFYR